MQAEAKTHWAAPFDEGASASQRPALRIPPTVLQTFCLAPICRQPLPNLFGSRQPGCELRQGC